MAMNIEIALALMAFAFVSSITPGPNNLMLLASGANFGLQRSLPHVAGVVLGFLFMLVLVGVGIMQVLQAYPSAYLVLQVFSIAYLIYLAAKLGFSNGSLSMSGNKAPMTFIQASLFQWVNPKGWAMALTAINAYAPSQSLAAVLMVALLFGLVNLPSILVWTCFGQYLSFWLANPKRLRVFNLVMAIMLLLTLVPVLML